MERLYLKFRKYTTSQVEQMKSALEKSGAIGRRITYPVRAILVGKGFFIDVSLGIYSLRLGPF